MKILAINEIEVPEGDFCNSNELCRYLDASEYRCNAFYQKLDELGSAAVKCRKCSAACKLSSIVDKLEL